jgi:hypothetical protein
MEKIIMQINIDDILPEKISDESAYLLVNFFMDLALKLESCYFDKMKRYIDDNMPSNPPIILKKSDDDEI